MKELIYSGIFTANKGESCAEHCPFFSKPGGSVPWAFCRAFPLSKENLGQVGYGGIRAEKIDTEVWDGNYGAWIRLDACKKASAIVKRDTMRNKNEV